MRKNIGAIWGNIDFLAIFGVKKHKIVGQNSQNGARSYTRILRKSLTPTSPKSQYVPQIAPIISSNFVDFLRDNLKNTPRRLSVKKVKKVPSVIVAIWGKLTFWAFFTSNCSYIMERFQAFKSLIILKAHKTISGKKIIITGGLNLVFIT